MATLQDISNNLTKIAGIVDTQQAALIAKDATIADLQTQIASHAADQSVVDQIAADEQAIIDKATPSPAPTA